MVEKITNLESQFQSFQSEVSILFNFFVSLKQGLDYSKKHNSVRTQRLIVEKLDNWISAEIPYLTNVVSSYPFSLSNVKKFTEDRPKKIGLVRILIGLKNKYVLLQVFMPLIKLAHLGYVISKRHFPKKQLVKDIYRKLRKKVIISVFLENISDNELRVFCLLICLCSEKKLKKSREIIKEINKRESHILVSHLFPTTWLPFIEALKSKGKHTTWLGVNPVKNFDSYGVCTNRKVSANKIVTEGLLTTLMVLVGAERCKILLSGECFIGSNWRKDDTTLLYLVMSAVTGMMQKQQNREKNLTLIMYDGIKPFSDQNENNKSISGLYKMYMRNADKIIFNSNTPEFGEFIFNACDIQVPKIHFYRYGIGEEFRNKSRLKTNQVHVACITVVLNEFGEPSRDGVTKYVYDLCVSGVHFHYFCNSQSPAVQNFRKSLGQFKKYFHTHKIERDPIKLVEKLSKYHLGFNPSDHVPFAKGIAGNNDRFYQDSISMFCQSTVGTSFLVYALAGLPVLLPRWCTGSTKLLGDSALPINMSEMENFSLFLSKIDLEKTLKKSEQNAFNFDINNRIEDYLKFIE
jgi:hypothetical protein